MDQTRWCFKQSKGLRMIEPNANMPKSYLNMAEESIKALEKLDENKIWKAATTYYVFYYSLYALMLRIGVKCEIHTCSILFMKKYLAGYYTNRDIGMIELAFSNRSDLQYYADRPVDTESIEACRLYCKDFFIKTKEILSKTNDAKIESLRSKIAQDSL